MDKVPKGIMTPSHVMGRFAKRFFVTTAITVAAFGIAACGGDQAEQKRQSDLPVIELDPALYNTYAVMVNCDYAVWDRWAVDDEAVLILPVDRVNEAPWQNGVPEQPDELNSAATSAGIPYEIVQDVIRAISSSMGMKWVDVELYEVALAGVTSRKISFAVREQTREQCFGSGYGAYGFFYPDWTGYLIIPHV